MVGIAQLRDYQQDVLQQIQRAWFHDQLKTALLVLPTGAGKTVVFSHVIKLLGVPACAIAHRQELVEQISVSLARSGVRHRIIGPRAVVKQCVQAQVRETGRSYYDPQADTGVAGVDTLVRSPERYRAFLERVQLWVQDEAHHVLKANKWGKAAALFPNAWGLGVTASPDRADDRGLGEHSDGVFQTLIEGPTCRELIRDGYLSDYRLIAPPGDFQRPGAEAIGSTGDITQQANKAAVRTSGILGDVVTHYQRHAAGLRAVVFAVDVESATDIAQRFKAAGVRAEVISAKTPSAMRAQLLAQFAAGEIQVLCNVDLFGEGFDLPALDCVIMARATESLSLYLQQVGRALRPVYADGYDLSTREGRLAAIAAGPKPKALVIDHVGNAGRHGLPDKARVWSLEGREKRARSSPNDAEPVRTCLNDECAAVYERFRRCCPYCGHYPQPESRAAPEFVDGDLIELDAATLAELRGEVERIDGPPPRLSDPAAARGAARNHRERQHAQAALRESIAWWAGYQRSLGREDHESYRRFYHAFGVDVLSAQALGRPEALALAQKINETLIERL